MLQWAVDCLSEHQRVPKRLLELRKDSLERRCAGGQPVLHRCSRALVAASAARFRRSLRKCLCMVKFDPFRTSLVILVHAIGGQAAGPECARERSQPSVQVTYAQGQKRKSSCSLCSRPCQGARKRPVNRRPEAASCSKARPSQSAPQAGGANAPHQSGRQIARRLATPTSTRRSAG